MSEAIRRVRLVLMKVARERGDIDAALLLVLVRFPDGPLDPALRAGLRALLVYAAAVTQHLPRRETMEEIRRRAAPAVGEVVMSGYELLLEKGRIEGVRAMLVRQLRKKFGAVDEATIDRITRAGLAELERWGDRVLEVEALAEVFDGP
jgi:hypothetical protein